MAIHGTSSPMIMRNPKHNIFVTSNANSEMWAKITLPITLDQLLTMCVGVGMHESGHLVGLVSQTFLGGTANPNGGHNQGNNSQYFMNNGLDTLYDWRLELHPEKRKFNELNTKCLKFTFPTE